MPKFLWLLKPLKLKNLHLKPFDIVRGTRVSKNTLLRTAFSAILPTGKAVIFYQTAKIEC